MMTTYFILIVQFVCLSIWLGGILVILTVVAPQVFRALEREQAARAMPRILSKFSSFLLGDLVVLTISLWLQLVMLSGPAAIRLRIAVSLTCLSILLTVYDRYGVSPRLERIGRAFESGPEEKERKEFRRLHARSMILFVVNLILGFAVVMTLIAPLRSF